MGSNMSSLMSAVRNGDVQAVDALVAKGENIHEVDGDGWNAIHWAVYNKNADMLRYLISKGVSKNTPAKRGFFNGLQTPLHVACQYDCLEGAMLLLNEPRADMHALDQSGYNPLHYCAYYGKASIIHTLLVHGLDPNISLGGRVKQTEADKSTALEVAVERNNPSCAEALVHVSSDVAVSCGFKKALDNRNKGMLQVFLGSGRITVSRAREAETKLSSLLRDDEVLVDGAEKEEAAQRNVVNRLSRSNPDYEKENAVLSTLRTKLAEAKTRRSQTHECYAAVRDWVTTRLAMGSLAEERGAGRSTAPFYPAPAAGSSSSSSYARGGAGAAGGSSSAPYSSGTPGRMAPPSASSSSSSSSSSSLTAQGTSGGLLSSVGSMIGYYIWGTNGSGGSGSGASGGAAAAGGAGAASAAASSSRPGCSVPDDPVRTPTAPAVTAAAPAGASVSAPPTRGGAGGATHSTAAASSASSSSAAHSEGGDTDPSRPSASASASAAAAAAEVPSCIVCMDNNMDTALIPCGHVLCQPCATAIVRDRHQCPVCRKSISTTVKLYI